MTVAAGILCAVFSTIAGRDIVTPKGCIMNRQAFYAELRKANSGVFGKSLSQAQVNTCEALLNECDARGLTNPETAYVMATAYHEAKMVPSRENLYYTTAGRIAAVWPSRFTAASAKAYTRNPKKLANKVYNGRLGNRMGTNDGWDHRGGGLDHLTGRDNYRKASAVVGVDLVAKPSRILEPEIAVESLVHGMINGRYRGKKLTDYIRPGSVNFAAARNIINADAKANGELVAGYARAFLKALEAGRRPYSPAPKATTPAAETPARSPWAALVDLFAAFIKGLGAKK